MANTLDLMGLPLELSTLGCSSTHNNTLQELQRTALVPAPRKALFESNVFSTFASFFSQ